MTKAHDFGFRTIDGAPLPLDRFAGKALLIVNTASECGFTPQYAGLVELWRRYRERGLVVLAVPSNDFGAQEPGEEHAIAAFCRTTYGVDFPLAAKERVSGKEAHPFYRWIAEEFGEAAVPRWNFHKYLVAPDGELVEIFPSKVEPLDKALIEAVEATLPGAGPGTGR
ncbi:MAG TPA: glutathione peroxidase [Alphaproteobacteria bacterium]|nr:glutathione peroxidase [Alphaproteobacteria bacterium]